MKTTRRSFLQTTMAAAAAAGLPWHVYMRKAYGAPLIEGLSDPAVQEKFVNAVPRALDPGFIYNPRNDRRRGLRQITVGVGPAQQYTGLKNNNALVPTDIWGYGEGGAYTWPGKTFQVKSGEPLQVTWENRLNGLTMPVTSLNGRSVIDTSLHWAYSLAGYTQYSVEQNGVPIVPHVHGGHNDWSSDGNPEFFFSPDWQIRGPEWRTRTYEYPIDQPAGTIWYHDHALGITRLNVYSGMAGFYIVRDDDDTGMPNNSLSLPTYPYEAALAIQDKMFLETGGLFYPAFPGDPFYADFINGEGANLPSAQFPGGGPSALAEFFGDHMVVNGVIWPKMEVEPRNYRLRLLNGCDSRFLVVRFRQAETTGSQNLTGAGDPIPFKVIGSDQGLGSDIKTVDTLVVETGSRYDIIFDFGSLNGKRIIMENIGGDTPFGFTYGEGLGPDDVFPNRQTDRVMAFDVVVPFDNSAPDVSPSSAALAAYATAREAGFGGYQFGAVDRTRKVALYEGKDEYGRLQPLLGTAEPATDYAGNPVNWPDTAAFRDAGLIGQMDGSSLAWHVPTTENPKLGDTEEWQIFNVTGDSHPIHLHLVHFQVVGRKAIKWDTNADGDGFIPAGVDPVGNGTYLVPQPVVQHNGTLGSGFKIVNATFEGPFLNAGSEYADSDLPKDMVTARPGEVTFIKAKFDKPGRYVWHCHILSHEDHEMMRVLHVGPEFTEGQGNQTGTANQPAERRRRGRTR